MKYSGKCEGVKLDELIGGNYRGLITRNIEVSEGVKRGDILASESPLGVYKLAGTGDEEKYLVVAAADFDAEEGKITQGYTEGVFNRSKLRVSAGATVEGFESALRKQNIELTTLVANMQPAY